MTDRQTGGSAHDVATLAGGCFWCLEAVFELVEGVERVDPGYTGGSLNDPTYEQICTGNTGHAEAVQLTFDPTVVSYRELLDLFFVTHDPTTLDRQGQDIGSQYRSAVFYHSPEQRQAAEAAIAELTASGAWNDPIVTEVVPLAEYYQAEEYHREYYRRNPNAGYCQVIIAPKVAKLRKERLAALKA
ncbi:MAG: peptide-methionine (S)-S-oxide reductase MsrA [Chloroflexi bacterium]|nr:peptide-methionine (S)-S-oxide reductase MsrA [Chloroflexota bacterium]